jgi:hypothetical protein
VQRLCSYWLYPTAVSVFPDSRFRSTCTSSFSRIARRSLTLRPAHSRCHRISWQLLPEGFKHFVTSILAPVATGWSSGQVGLTPTGKRRLCTAHRESRLMICSAIWGACVTLPSPVSVTLNVANVQSHSENLPIIVKSLAWLANHPVQI